MLASCIFISYANFRRSLKHYLIIKVHCLSRCLSSNSDIISCLPNLVNNFFNFFKKFFVVIDLSDFCVDRFRNQLSYNTKCFRICQHLFQFFYIFYLPNLSYDDIITLKNISKELNYGIN